MKNPLLLASLLFAVDGFSQNVGINTNTPATTLQVIGQPASAATADGVTVPLLTGDQLRAKDAAFTASQTGTLVYVTAAATTTSAKTTNVTAAGMYYFDGSTWQRVIKGYSPGQLLNSVFIDDPALSVTSTNSTSFVDLVNYSYTPMHNNSRIMVQYHNSNYQVGGNTGPSTDQFRTQLLINGSSVTTNTQTMEIQGSANTAFRTGTIFPIAGVANNSTTSAILIRVQVQRSSGDDVITFHGSNGTLIIQEIAN